MKHKFLAFLLIPAVVFSNYFYDEDHVRYELYQSNGGKAFNWLFLPGGPGVDSSYFRSLIDQLDLPGNVWLIDLPGNGTNEQGTIDYDHWFEIYPKVIRRFDHSILVGHSFGGMFPLLFPELEECLDGFVVLNSAPCLWKEEAVSYAKQFDLPDFSQEVEKFILNPTQETFATGLDACMPYYFPKRTLEKGRALFLKIPTRYQAACWWLQKSMELNFDAKWIPQKVPTFIIGSKFDCICPHHLYQNDQRFHRSNVKFFFVEDAGHFIWIDNLEATQKIFNEIISTLGNSHGFRTS
jgi:pimeloyl-ACP methyl ester carboxylesterase